MKNWFRSWHPVTTVGAVGVQHALKKQLSVVTIIHLFFSFPKNLKTFSSQESPPKAGKIIQAKGFCIPMAWSFFLFIPSISALPSRCLVMFLLLSVKFKLTSFGMRESMPCFQSLPNRFWLSGLWQVFLLGCSCLIGCLFWFCYSVKCFLKVSEINVIGGQPSNGYRFQSSKRKALGYKIGMVLTVVKSVKSEDTKTIFDIRVLPQCFLVFS